MSDPEKEKLITDHSQQIIDTPAKQPEHMRPIPLLNLLETILCDIAELAKERGSDVI